MTQFGLQASRVVAIPLAAGLPSATPLAAPREEWLLAVGGPSPRKGSDRLPAFVRQWTASFGRPPRIRWVGSTPFRDPPRYFTELGLGDVVEFLGHVDDRRLDRLYRRAGALLVLSDTEGFGLPLLEAAARGCPVLALASETLVEVLGEAAFWMQEPFTACAPILERFAMERERETVAERAARRAGEFSWERTAEETLSCYDRARSE